MSSTVHYFYFVLYIYLLGSSHYTSGSGSSTYDNAQFTSQLTGPYNAGIQPMSIGGRDTIHDTMRHPAVNSPVFGRAFPNPAIQSTVPGDPKVFTNYRLHIHVNLILLI